ncbi:hypothetical protein GCM10027057_26770 [Marisediminicola antarctica]
MTVPPVVGPPQIGDWRTAPREATWRGETKKPPLSEGLVGGSDGRRSRDLTIFSRHQTPVGKPEERQIPVLSGYLSASGHTKVTAGVPRLWAAGGNGEAKHNRTDCIVP